MSPRYLYTILRPERYAQTEERDEFVNELKSLGLQSTDFNPGSVVDGKNLIKTLDDFDDDLLAAFIEVLSKYCLSKPRTSAK